MFICVGRWKEPGDDFFKYEILDTSEFKSEVVTKQTIVKAFNVGLSILGLVNKDNGKIGVDSFMESTQDYRFYNNRDMHISKNVLNVESWNTDNSLISVRGSYNSGDKRLYKVYKDDVFVGKFSLPYKINNFHYVDVNSIANFSYKGNIILDVHCSYYDKHYYREDRGESFSKRILIYKKSVIEQTDFLCDADGYFESDLYSSNSELNSGKFKWCNKEVDLDKVV